MATVGVSKRVCSAMTLALVDRLVFEADLAGRSLRKLVPQQAAVSLDGYIYEEGTEFWRSFGPAALPPAA